MEMRMKLFLLILSASLFACNSDGDLVLPPADGGCVKTKKKSLKYCKNEKKVVSLYL
jgi:predicted small lipoprotein YifL